MALSRWDGVKMINTALRTCKLKLTPTHMQTKSTGWSAFASHFASRISPDTLNFHTILFFLFIIISDISFKQMIHTVTVFSFHTTKSSCESSMRHLGTTVKCWLRLSNSPGRLPNGSTAHCGHRRCGGQL